MPINWSTIWRVFVGGALGTLFRFSVDFVGGQLLALMIANLLGAALLGLMNGHKRFAGDKAGALWKVGFTGGFTTMSGLALFMALNRAPTISILSVVLVMLLGIVFYRLGKAAGVSWSR